MSFLELKGVGKEYRTNAVKVEALKDVSFSLEDGEFAVVLGSSGAGKTTLLNLLGGMDDATSGEIVLDNKNVTSLDKKGLCEYRRNDVGFIFQFYNLMPNLTALENVEIAVEICKNHLDPASVLKEPTGALDYATGKMILKLLHDVSKERKRLVIVVTHNQALKDMADKVIRIKSGRIESVEINENPKPIEEIEW